MPRSGLHLRDVHLGFGRGRGLAGLTLSLTEARIGIVGRNGSGKTTLLRVMAGLVAPQAGRVEVDGIDPAADRRGALARIGILFQNPDHQILFPTVAEELAFGLRQGGMGAAEAEARVAARLAAEGLAHWGPAQVVQLSQGQRQLVCLLAVLLMAPATLLLDEPFAALDLPAQARMRRRLAALPQRVVTISHDPAALAGVERVVWLEAGRVAGDGPPGEVLPRFRAAMEEAGARDADADLSG
jgi:biotin transport system ATP-binding protein